MTNKTKSFTIRLPMGLYNKIATLAKQNRLNPHAYVIKTLWGVTKWDGNNPAPIEEDTQPRQ